MKLIAIPFFVLKTLVLKPLDYLFYGGSGVLWRSRDEWRKMIRDAMPAGTVMAGSRFSAADEDDWSPYIPSVDIVRKSSGCIVDDAYLFENPPFSAEDRF